MTTSSNPRTKTILLVDDEEQLLTLLEKFLVKEGFNVILAQNGKVAVDVYKADPGSIDMVLMDIVMPIMSGIEACRELVKFDAQVPIMLMSGFPKDSLECFDHMNFIRKPMHHTEFSAFIKEIKNVANSTQQKLS
jgi:DNA-binding response OmpR family regulator